MTLYLNSHVNCSVSYLVAPSHIEKNIWLHLSSFNSPSVSGYEKKTFLLVLDIYCMEKVCISVNCTVDVLATSSHRQGRDHTLWLHCKTPQLSKWDSYCMAMTNYVQIKDFALILVFKTRLKVTWKWPTYWSAIVALQVILATICHEKTSAAQTAPYFSNIVFSTMATNLSVFLC